MFTDSHLANMPAGKLYFLFASLSLVQIVFSQAPSTPPPLSLFLSVCHLLSPSFSYLSLIFCPVFSLYPYSISCYFLFCLSSLLFHQIFHPPLAYSISAPSPKPPFCNIPQLQTHTESSLLPAFPIIELQLSQPLNWTLYHPHPFPNLSSPYTPRHNSQYNSTFTQRRSQNSPSHHHFYIIVHCYQHWCIEI